MTTDTDREANVVEDVRAFCKAYGIPRLLDQAEDADRRAVHVMKRALDGHTVAHYLAGLRWRMLPSTGSRLPIWEAFAFDSRAEPTTPPEFGQWLDGRPNERLLRTAPVLLDAIRRARALAIAEYRALRSTGSSERNAGGG